MADQSRRQFWDQSLIDEAERAGESEGRSSWCQASDADPGEYEGGATLPNTWTRQVCLCGKYPFYTFLAFSVPAISNFLVGFDLGVMRSMGEPVRMFSSGSPHIRDSIYSSLFGTILAAMLMFYRGDKFGRRRALILGSLFYLAGGSLILVLGKNQGWFCLGRGVYGMGSGICMYASPIYVAEMSPRSIRGFLICLKQCFIPLGMLAAYIAVLCFDAEIPLADAARGEFKVNARHQVYFISLVAAFMQLIGMYLLAPTPRWTVMQGKQGYADKAHLTLCRVAASPIEIERFTREIVDLALSDAAPPTLYEVVCSYNMRCVLLPLAVMIQLCGVPTLLLFSDALLSWVNSVYSLQLSHSAVLVGCTALLVFGAIFSAVVVDQVGRKHVLLSGVAGTGLGLLCTAAAILALHLGPDSASWSDLTVGAACICICGTVMVFEMAVAPLLWLLATELSQLRWRGRVVALLVVVDAVSQAAFVLVLQISHPTASTMMEGSLNWMTTALVLSSFTVVVLGMMCRFLPETRGQSLEGSTRVPTSPRGVPTHDEQEGNTMASPLTNHLASGSVSPPGNPSLVAYRPADGMLSAHSSSSSIESLGLVFASVPSQQGNNFSRQHSGMNNQWSNSQSQLSKSSFLTAATTNSAIGQNFSRQNSSLDISGGTTNMHKSSSRTSLVAMPPVPPKGDARGR